MNKLTKVGCSALCGSLAAISAAQAGDLTVTGGVDMSWVSLSGQNTGNPIGMGSNLTFKGSGELDNGWTFDLTVANANASAYSAANATITMGGLGKLNVNQGNSGNGIQAFDDKMPSAWEEPWGAGLTTGIILVSGIGKSANVQYTTPKVLGLTLTGAWAPAMGATDTGDKTGSGVIATSGKEQGYDLTVNLNPSLGTEVLSGLNIFVGGHYTEIRNSESNDLYEGVAGITYDIGPISLGYGKQGQLTGKQATATDVAYYKNSHYGIALNISDDLSISYGHHESYQGDVNNTDDQLSKKLEVDSAQIAYTMGGASIRIAEIRGDNLSYTATNDKDATVVSLSLAF